MTRRKYTPRAFAPLAMAHMANVERSALWAKPGMGKTSLATNIAFNAARRLIRDREDGIPDEKSVGAKSTGEKSGDAKTFDDSPEGMAEASMMVDLGTPVDRKLEHYRNKAKDKAAAENLKEDNIRADKAAEALAPQLLPLCVPCWLPVVPILLNAATLVAELGDLKRFGTARRLKIGRASCRERVSSPV